MRKSRRVGRRRRTGALGWVAVVGLALVLVVGVSPTSMALNRGASTSASPHPKDAKCAVGSDPEQPAYDPTNHYVYVPNAGSGDVSIIKPPCKLVATIVLPTGSVPVSAVFDPVNNDVYVDDYFLAQVYVISGIDLIQTITSSDFDEPYFMTFNPGDNSVAVPNLGGDTVSFIASNGAVTAVPVGNNPVDVGYDPYYATLLVANIGSDNITILSAVYESHVGDVPVGVEPEQVVYDVADHDDYVVNHDSDNVTVIVGNGFLVGSVNVGRGPIGVAWSQAALEVFVANTDSDNISVIQGLSVVQTIKLPPNAAPYGEAFSDYNGEMYVTGYNSGLLYLYA